MYVAKHIKKPIIWGCEMKLLKYKDYIGSVEYSKEEGMYFGTIQGIKPIVLYDGKTIEELEETFRESVDDFIGYYLEIGEEAPISYRELLVV